MSSMRCTACGAPLADDAVICLNCGRVAGRRQPPKRPQPRNIQRPVQPRPQPRQTQNQTRPAGQPPRRPAPRTAQPAPRPVQRQPRPAQPRPQQTRPAPARVPRPVYAAPPPEVQAKEAQGKFKRNTGVKGKLRLAALGFAAALFITVIYIAGALIQTTRVRLSTYHFKSSMKMTYSSYGKAMDNYFEDGHWSANLFTRNCTYVGKNKHGEEYEMVFSAGVKVKLKSITIDGEPVDKDLIETKVMGMFI